MHLVTLDKEHGTQTVVAVADIILGEIKELLLTFQNFRQVPLHAVDPSDNWAKAEGTPLKTRSTF